MNTFVQNYIEVEKSLMDGINTAEFDNAISILTAGYKEDKQIFVMGNGGSAATANHFAGDFSKNAIQDKGQRRFRVLTLSESPEKISMYGNDCSFEEIFFQQLQNLMNDGDVLISISSSGNSPDLLKACAFAKSKNAKIIGLNGFEGGKVKDFADANLIVPTSCYEQIEDVHLIFCHMFVAYYKANPDVLV